MFGASALYHRVPWRSARARAWARRVDHSMIFVFIAGTYTPFALLAFSGVLPAVVLACVWAGAALGIVLNVSWIDAPKWVIAPVYLLVGLGRRDRRAAVLHASSTSRRRCSSPSAASSTRSVPIAYATHWPDPFPATFGFHEVFHVLVLAAAVSQFVAVSFVVL